MVTYHFLDEQSLPLLRRPYEFKHGFYDTHTLLVQGAHLKYRIFLWSPQHKKDTELLEMLQRGP